MIRILSLALLLSFSITLLSCGPAPQPPAPEEVKTTPTPTEAPALEEGKGAVKGIATVTLRGHEKPQILSAMELVLLPSDAEEPLKKVREERWLAQATGYNFADGYRYLDLNAIGFQAVELALQRSKTNAEGSFHFHNIDPGNYLLYGQYVSRYAKAYWLVPITIEAGKTLEQNLDNDSAKEIHNNENLEWK